jgi:hypothetical protein
MTTENKPRTLDELIAKHHGEEVEYSNAELIASLIAWHKAELERYGEKVKEACLDLVRKEPCEVYPAVLASDMKAMPLPPIEQEGASRE